MPVKRRKWSREFKAEAVQLLESDPRPGSVLARELGIERGMLYRWRKELLVGTSKKASKRQSDDAGQEESPSEPRPEQVIKALRKRVKELELEKEILKKATAFFAKESE